jgi:hypothetical protein
MDATNACSSLPYVTPMKSDRVPKPKEIVNLMSSNEERTCLDDEKQTDLANVSSGMLPGTAAFEKACSTTFDDGTFNAGSYKSDKSECLL